MSTEALDSGDAAFEFTPTGEAALKLSGLMNGRAAEAN